MSRRRTPAPLGSPPARVVALGGGHGLSATLTALRRVTDGITAVVGVADDGGSSGRLREEFGVLPPGDLRMALAALCSDDAWGRTWREVIQHRFPGEGPLGGHSVGNLLISALWQQTGDPVEGLEWVAALLEARGRVLPAALVPLAIEADVTESSGRRSVVRGQASVATASGTIARVRIDPPDPPVPPAALEAIANADAIVLGPGSWYTSVLATLLVPALRTAVETSPARRLLVLNLDPRTDAETAHVPMSGHLRALREVAPNLRIDACIADPAHVDDLAALEVASAAVGAQLVLAPLGYAHPSLRGRHDPDRLAVAIREALGG